MKRLMGISTIFIVMFGSAVRGEVDIWPTSAETKVKRLQEEFDKQSYIWSGGDSSIKLAGAGGEHIYFQVIIAVDRDSVNDVTVEMEELISGRNTIPAENIQVYFCPLVKVYAASTEHGQTGWYPDPLVKLSKPVDIRPARWQYHINQTFWIEIVIPRGAKLGTYIGKVTVNSAGRKLEAFPVELTARGFDLPDIFHQYALFNCSRDRLSSYYNKDRLAGRNLDKLLAVYFDFMLERGIQPWFNPLIEPRFEEKNGGLELNWPDTKWEAHFLNHPAYRRVTFRVLPRGLSRRAEHEGMTEEWKRTLTDWVGGIYKHYKANGWQDKLSFFGPLDEPNTLDAYEKLMQWGGLVRSLAPDINYQVTEQPLPQEPSWPSLAAVATDWVVNGKDLEYNREEMVHRIAAGDNVCWYVACDQTWPMANYFIDEPGIDPRMVPWITYNYRLKGILYWAVNFWTEVRSPWRDPVTWKRSSCNAPLAGEGSLLYPGEEIEEFCGQENVNGPVSSIRLEMLRKGIEDVEYIYMLADRGMEKEAMRLCKEMVISTDVFSRDPARLEKVKQEAAKLLALGN